MPSQQEEGSVPTTLPPNTMKIEKVRDGVWLYQRDFAGGVVRWYSAIDRGSSFDTVCHGSARPILNEPIPVSFARVLLDNLPASAIDATAYDYQQTVTLERLLRFTPGAEAGELHQRVRRFIDEYLLAIPVQAHRTCDYLLVASAHRNLTSEELASLEEAILYLSSER